jgi:hypothetical protein
MGSGHLITSKENASALIPLIHEYIECSILRATTNL